MSISLGGLIVAVTALLVSACQPTPGNTVFLVEGSGLPSQAIDVLFVPDDDYGDMNDPTNRQAFLDDVDQLVNQGFAMNNAINVNLSLFSFWFMTLTGDVQLGTGICPSVAWPDLSGGAFADVIVLVHANPLRDCAWGNRVTSEPSDYGTVVHEASHAAFGLPDEYCCDGGYWRVAPVMYDSETACTSDPLSAAWRTCQSFTSNQGREWWRSENGNSDIMRAVDRVREYGPGDWEVVKRILSNLPGAVVETPLVFAPAEWP